MVLTRSLGELMEDQMGKMGKYVKMNASTYANIRIYICTRE